MSDERPVIRIPVGPPPEWEDYIKRKEEDRRREETEHTGSTDKAHQTGSVVIIQL